MKLSDNVANVGKRKQGSYASGNKIRRLRRIARACAFYTIYTFYTDKTPTRLRQIRSPCGALRFVRDFPQHAFYPKRGRFCR